MSRSEMKRVAVQKGEPMPTFERSLRDAAIQHMAEAMKGYGDSYDAQLGLDALLDFLGAHTEEWAEAAQPDNDRVHYEGVAAELIRGLR